MAFELLGWPDEEVTLDLDHRDFPYAGKFVMSSTGKAISRSDGDVVAAASFSADRTDSSQLWIRYLAVHREYQGEGLGEQLCRGVHAAARERGYETVVIAVNNPHAYVSAYRAGFAFTGRETGIAELILSTAAERTQATYQDGLERFLGRNGIDSRFIQDKLDEATPADQSP